jgi:hypothetical protein
VTGPVDTYAAGTKQLIDDAQRLGISWTLRPGTVTISSPLKVTFDGDDTPITAVSLIGVLAEATRVMGLLIPPGGNFIVGYNDGNTHTSRLAPFANFAGAGALGSTSSATFVNIPILPFVTVVKQFDANTSNISLIMSQSLFTTIAATGVEFGINLAGGVGTDVLVSSGFLNPATTHLSYTTTKLLTGLAPGTYTLSGRWRRYSGTGILNTNSDDWSSILAGEVWAT